MGAETLAPKIALEVESADGYHTVCQSDDVPSSPTAGPGASAPHKSRPFVLGWFGVDLQIAPNFKEYYLFIVATIALSFGQA